MFTPQVACATIAAEPFFAFSSKTRYRSAKRPSRATPRPASPENYPSLVSDFAWCGCVGMPNQDGGPFDTMGEDFQATLLIEW